MGGRHQGRGRVSPPTLPVIVIHLGSGRRRVIRRHLDTSRPGRNLHMVDEGPALPSSSPDHLRLWNLKIDLWWDGARV